MLFLVIFFFQAEDVIRYLTVTGVQTCALPISIMGGGRKVFFFMRGPMARSTQPDVNQHPARVAPRPTVPGAKGPSIWDRLVRYAREVWAELKRVDWPSRPELVASTIVVVAVLAVLSAYLGAWDALFTWLFTQVLGH